ncbi:hypothetical protein FGO68_gene17754 [Halteria grandinella]|uniref:Uncharacterized protein n=1 Tax=Halteria grandinella TaxID=5974 RepID=A0A8J8NZH9_HALGN|nr:hypothetical protein FGO68_gene17754 [Halteria grandinella]
MHASTRVLNCVQNSSLGTTLPGSASLWCFTPMCEKSAAWQYLSVFVRSITCFKLSRGGGVSGGGYRDLGACPGGT